MWDVKATWGRMPRQLICMIWSPQLRESGLDLPCWCASRYPAGTAFVQLTGAFDSNIGELEIPTKRLYRAVSDQG